jgi:hypothetical protein
MADTKFRDEIEKMIAQTEALLVKGRELEARIDAFYQHTGIEPGSGLGRLLDGCRTPRQKALTQRLLQESLDLPKRTREMMRRQEMKKLGTANISVARSRFRI